MEYFIGFIVGVVFGAVVAIVVGYLRSRSVEGRMRETFAATAGEALDANSRRLAETAGVALESKKELIDQSIKAIDERLTRMGDYFRRLEADRKQDFGALSASVGSLSATAGKLHEMLSSSKRRGAWGERMAEDILRLAGLQEGVNYTKQSAQAAESGLPDFTFILPNDLKANMDVKFPLEAYKGYLDAESEPQRNEQLKSLVTAVRKYILITSKRKYIDPTIPTVDYVLMFVPSEQIFSLVLESQPDLIDQALAAKVVLCSPLTLYAMLAVIRQAAERANLTRTADEALELLAEVQKQWQRFKDSMDVMGERIDKVKQEYDHLVTTRTRALDRPMGAIDNLRTSCEPTKLDSTQAED